MNKAWIVIGIIAAVVGVVYDSQSATIGQGLTSSHG